MKIAVTGGKGGVGKSMVATSLAVEFARKKKTKKIRKSKKMMKEITITRGSVPIVVEILMRIMELRKERSFHERKEAT